VTSSTPWPLYPVQRASTVHWVEGCVEPNASLSVAGKITFTAYTEIQIHFSSSLNPYQYHYTGTVVPAID